MVIEDKKAISLGPLLNEVLANELKNEIEYERFFIKYKLDNQANVIMIYGPTGSGKTYSVINILKERGLKYWVADMKQYSEVGYEGSDILDIFTDFWNQQIYDDNSVENGVIVFDESDKIQSSTVSSKDVSGLGIQQSLLKLIDGIDVRVSSNQKSRTHPNAFINTRKMTFIFLGAFDYLNNFYGKSSWKWRSCLKENGFMPELIDRINYVHYLQGPTLKDFVDLLSKKTVC